MSSLAAADGEFQRARPPYSLRWISNTTASSSWTLEAAVANAKTLAELRAANWTQAQWHKLLTVHVEQGNALGSVGLPPMLGAYRVGETAIHFEPQFPLEPGVRYVASFFPTRLPGVTEGKFMSTTFELPRRIRAASTRVTQIYPTASVLPENLLKFYVHFSAPMSRGHIYDHIHLRNAAGKDVQLPFLEIDEELWNPEMTRLTLFIDPGRIKREVKPLEDIGPALEAGKQFTLTIDRAWKDATGTPLKDNFNKPFVVSPPDRTPIDPAAWKIQPPAAGTRSPLTITFPKPIDHALAQRVMQVADSASRALAGVITLENQEQRWSFVPKTAWRKGTHALLVQTTIEDLAGNNIGKAFEVDLFDTVERRFTNGTVRLPFEIR